MVGYYIKGVDKYGSNDAGPWDYVQGSSRDSASVRQQKLGGDRGDVEDNGWISPLGG